MFEAIKAWIRRHRKGLITASVVAIVGGAAILIINGKKVKMPLTEVAKKIIPEAPVILAKDTTNITISIDGVMNTFPRSSFIRQLCKGWKASAAKAAQATEMGISLNPGETIVNACIVTMRTS